MGKSKIDMYVVGPVQTNCYFVINEETKEMVIIDPGASAKQLADRVRKDGYTPVAILLTHGHFDHATGAKELAEEFGIEIYAHELEQETLEDPELNASWMMGGGQVFHADKFLEDEQVMELAGFSIKVLLTPGHTVGGCCYYLDEEGIVFSGDTLFCMSIGRTDFKKGSMSDLVRSVKEKLFTLPGDTTVYPGHNDVTTIEYERVNNPFIS